ncbi:hypothetical protein NI389_20815 (plasmid) [Pseudoalteromonas xiamenensis]|uniref:hypothetical protein n=1 Tax=Pseudoalteromonas xiamenensis TaxID=882626 RepID=UPI0027E53F8F|nr:hypothetical protein [Pseudoalteromonas xiamenensis]WMN62238.1 hypothetical protein NI389_20815 [Pseudoalteromonas xiamenensis]
MLYTLLGSINAALIMMSAYGVLLQLKSIYDRQVNHKDNPTAVLSVNQFTVSFIAYFSFYLYAIFIEPINHFLAWPRLLASVLTWLILVEIYRDRQTRYSKVSSLLGGFFLCGGLLALTSNVTFIDEGRRLSTCLIIVASLLIAQGYTHQFIQIIKSRSTGAINLKMSQYILLMDISTIAFALTMPLIQGWPFLVLACTSAVTKLVMMYLFYWVKQFSANNQKTN